MTVDKHSSNYDHILPNVCALSVFIYIDLLPILFFGALKKTYFISGPWTAQESSLESTLCILLFIPSSFRPPHSYCSQTFRQNPQHRCQGIACIISGTVRLPVSRSYLPEPDVCGHQLVLFILKLGRESSWSFMSI